MTETVDLRLGVDVGGTNTDAVVVDATGSLMAKAKVPTTPEVSAGIAAAIRTVLAQGPFGADRVTHAMVGTTHATNALVERRGLQRTAVVRIGAPATTALPPLATWPAELRAAVAAATVTIGGGFQLDGREIAPLDRDALSRFLEELDDGIEAVAITSVFASVSQEHEVEAERVVREILGDVHVSLSHEIGTVGLIERENATVLNAALAGVAREVALALDQALLACGISPSIYVAQNDGTLMGLDYALDHPVLTIASGPANSMRGAAHLSGTTDAVVVDVGGSSTDVGLLVNGYPSESPLASTIGGVTTNFRTPALVSLPIGGGTPITRSGGRVMLGAVSLGHRVRTESLVFGGSTPTLTDAVVAAGRASIGQVGCEASARRTLAAALAEVDALVAGAVDAARLARVELPLVAVGGLGELVVDHVPGVTDVRRPEHHDVANAIGAAIAHVGGEYERIFARGARRKGLAEAEEGAFQNAVRAGADPERIEIVEVEEVPVYYLVDPGVRIRVKASGPLGAP